METEINRPPDEGPRPRPRSPGRLEDLRRQADRYRQAAHEAIAHGLGRGDCEEQFANLRNSGGQ